MLHLSVFDHSIKNKLKIPSNNDVDNFYLKFTVVLLKYNYDSSDRIRFIL